MAEGLIFSLEILGEQQVAREFLRWSERALDAHPLWQAIYHDLMLIEKVQFLTEGAHGSGGWPQLAASTIRSKKARGLEPWILRATNALFKSLTEEGAEYQIFENFGDYMRFGTIRPAAEYHMTGTSRMPMRKPVQLTEIERRSLARSVQRFIVTGEATSITEFG